MAGTSKLTLNETMARTAGPGLLRAARSWIADCEWTEIGPDDVADLTDAQVVAGIRRHYAGGWPQFLLDSGD